MTSIPLNYVADVTPGVISAGSSLNTLPAVMLSQNAAFPTGVAVPFSSAADIADLVGSDQLEAELAASYLAGFTNSPTLPSKLYVARVSNEATAGALIGAALSKTLAELQAQSGTLTVVIDGTAKTTEVLDFSTATSFSQIASIIQTGLGEGVVTYNSGTGGFIITSGTTGAASSVSFASGALATPLGLTLAAGAVQSAGFAAGSLSAQMDAIKGSTDMAAFFCAYDPQADIPAYEAWLKTQDMDVAGILHDTAVTPALISAGTSLAQEAATAGIEGVAFVYADPAVAAMIAAIPASVDFTAQNGRYTAAFRRQTGITPSVTNKALATQLEGAGYNFYGQFAGSGQTRQFLFPGCISGSYRWLDSYFNQIWMRRNFQLAIVDGFLNIPQIPYNAQGDAILENILSTPIQAAINFGAIRTGVVLSEQQVQNITLALGNSAAITIQTTGYYLATNAASTPASRRALRATPPAVFYYTDGQSVQRINIPSYEVE